MADDFKDHFSDGSEHYASHRPTYPDTLFTFLAELAPTRSCVWDCATGNGQAALALADHFDRVVATDASAAQVRQATAHPKIEFRVAPAENSSLNSSAFDLVTVAQAFHWFNAKQFFAEAQRVLKPNGILALWSYAICRVDVGCDAVIDHLYRGILDNYWTPERDMVEQGYNAFALPGSEIDTAEFVMSLDWTADDMLGYLGTWSAGRRYRAEHGIEPVSLVADELRKAWGSGRRRVTWPLHTRISRLNALN